MTAPLTLFSYICHRPGGQRHRRTKPAACSACSAAARACDCRASQR